MTYGSTADERVIERVGESAFTRRGAEDCPECRAMVGTPHLDGCSGQFHEEAVGTAYPTDSAQHGGSVTE
jgi:hypothetical protein